MSLVGGSRVLGMSLEIMPCPWSLQASNLSFLDAMRYALSMTRFLTLSPTVHSKKVKDPWTEASETMSQKINPFSLKLFS
jgi:hypothetical protein